VILVDVFNKWLDTGSLDEFLLVEALLGLGEVTSDTGDKEMGESVFLNDCCGTLLPSS
jgi:hypothetical protein